MHKQLKHKIKLMRAVVSATGEKVPTKAYRRVIGTRAYVKLFVGICLNTIKAPVPFRDMPSRHRRKELPLTDRECATYLSSSYNVAMRLNHLPRKFIKHPRQRARAATNRRHA